jgi:hypothetical protein
LANCSVQVIHAPFGLAIAILECLPEMSR